MSPLTVRPRRATLKDGRMSSVLGRRLLDGAVKHPGLVIPMETLAREVWPDGPPKTWRVCLPHLAQQVNARLGAVVLERIGTPRRIDGYRLHVKHLPHRSVTTKPSKPPGRWDWTPKEDRVIAENVPGLLLDDLTALVNRQHGHRHTKRSVEARIYHLGLSKKGAEVYSVHRLAPILGVGDERVVNWIERGFLAATRWDQSRQATYLRKPGWWMIRHADVEAFIRAYSWELDWRAMQPGHPLTNLAMTVQRRNPYVTLAQAARQIGMCHQTLVRRIAEGDVPGAVRVTPYLRRSSPDLSCWRIPLAALTDIPRDKRRREVQTS